MLPHLQLLFDNKAQLHKQLKVTRRSIKRPLKALSLNDNFLDFIASLYSIVWQVVTTS